MQVQKETMESLQLNIISDSEEDHQNINLNFIQASSQLQPRTSLQNARQTEINEPSSHSQVKMPKLSPHLNSNLNLFSTSLGSSNELDYFKPLSSEDMHPIRGSFSKETARSMSVSGTTGGSQASLMLANLTAERNFRRMEYNNSINNVSNTPASSTNTISMPTTIYNSQIPPRHVRMTGPPTISLTGSNLAGDMQTFAPLPKRKGPIPKLTGKERCMVCEKPASGFNYLVLSCEGCKAFYRRSILKQSIYFCKENNNCDLRVKVKRMCQKCRLDKCIKLGMQLRDRYNSDSAQQVADDKKKLHETQMIERSISLNNVDSENNNDDESAIDKAIAKATSASRMLSGSIPFPAFDNFEQRQSLVAPKLNTDIPKIPIIDLVESEEDMTLPVLPQLKTNSPPPVSPLLKLAREKPIIFKEYKQNYQNMSFVDKTRPVQTLKQDIGEQKSLIQNRNNEQPPVLKNSLSKLSFSNLSPNFEIPFTRNSEIFKKSTSRLPSFSNFDNNVEIANGSQEKELFITSDPYTFKGISAAKFNSGLNSQQKNTGIDEPIQTKKIKIISKN